MIVLNIFRANR